MTGQLPVRKLGAHKETEAPIHIVIGLSIDFAEPRPVILRCFGKPRRYAVILRNDTARCSVVSIGAFNASSLVKSGIRRRESMNFGPMTNAVRSRPDRSSSISALLHGVPS
ncbi:hypothetical protein AJ87_20900 [Rhizobium yanglingense]|nr:hypothetical protein AJ87_20900 [Rhizobium yanglingense]